MSALSKLPIAVVFALSLPVCAAMAGDAPTVGAKTDKNTTAPAAAGGFTTGLAKPAPDGSTKIVPAQRCSPYARETDGSTTCVGIPSTR